MHRTHSFFGFYLYLVYNHQISGLISYYGYFLLSDCRNYMKKEEIEDFLLVYSVSSHRNENENTIRHILDIAVVF